MTSRLPIYISISLLFTALFFTLAAFTYYKTFIYILHVLIELICCCYMATTGTFYIACCIKRNYLRRVPVTFFTIMLTSLISGPLIWLILLSPAPEYIYASLIGLLSRYSSLVLGLYYSTIPLRVMRTIMCIRYFTEHENGKYSNSKDSVLKALRSYFIDIKDILVYSSDIVLLTIYLGLKGTVLGVGLLLLLGLCAPLLYLCIRIAHYDVQTLRDLLITSSVFSIAGCILLGWSVQMILS